MKNLTNEQLCELIKTGHKEAQSIIIEKNFSFIRKISIEIYKLANLSTHEIYIDTWDLTQEGCIALLRAANMYESNKNVRFITYAAPAIRNAITDLIRNELCSYEQKLQENFGTKIIHLDDILSDDEKAKRIEAIADPCTKNPEDIFIHRETMHELYHGLNQLSPRENAYLLYRYGFTDDLLHSRTQTATHFNLSENRAKRTEEQAMDNLWLELPWWYG